MQFSSAEQYIPWKDSMVAHFEGHIGRARAKLLSIVELEATNMRSKSELEATNNKLKEWIKTHFDRLKGLPAEQAMSELEAQWLAKREELKMRVAPYTVGLPLPPFCKYPMSSFPWINFT